MIHISVHITKNYRSSKQPQNDNLYCRNNFKSQNILNPPKNPIVHQIPEKITLYIHWISHLFHHPLGVSLPERPPQEKRDLRPLRNNLVVNNRIRIIHNTLPKPLLHPHTHLSLLTLQRATSPNTHLAPETSERIQNLCPETDI